MNFEYAILGVKIGVPLIVGGLAGGFGMYFIVEGVCQSFRKYPWLAGLVGALAGMGAGALLSSVLL